MKIAILISLIVFGLYNVNGQIPINGLVAHYTFDGDFMDSSGNSYHCSNQNAGFSSGMNGKANTALQLNGNISGARLDNGYPKIFTGSLTISAWVYFNDDTRAIIFGSYNTANNVSMEKHTNNRLRIWWNNGQRDFYSPVGTTSLEKWHLVSFVRDKAKDKFFIYLDGKEVANLSGVGTDVTPAGPFYIGRDSRTGTTAMNGKIDDVQIYNRALSSHEISSLFSSESARTENSQTENEKPQNSSSTVTQTQNNLPINVIGSWSSGGRINNRGRLNIWQEGNRFVVIVSWIDEERNLWKSYMGEGEFEGREMNFKVFPSVESGKTVDQGYVYHYKISADNNEIIGYYTRYGKKTTEETSLFKRVD